jgi:heme/copper-type cytochrome/quinol oxidase subunit 2
MMMIPIVLVILAALAAFALHRHRKSRRQSPDQGRTETSQPLRNREGQPWR